MNGIIKAIFRNKKRHATLGYGLILGSIATCATATLMLLSKVQ